MFQPTFQLLFIVRSATAKSGKNSLIISHNLFIRWKARRKMGCARRRELALRVEGKGGNGERLKDVGFGSQRA